VTIEAYSLRKKMRAECFMGKDIFYVLISAEPYSRPAGLKLRVLH
jgi:hypothetical protein